MKEIELFSRAIVFINPIRDGMHLNVFKNLSADTKRCGRKLFIEINRKMYEASGIR